MDPLSWAIGAAIFLAGGIAGRITRPKRRPNYKCACGHVLGAHDPKTGECGAQLGRRRTYSKGGNFNGHEIVACACMRYVGERPPPELDEIMGSIQGGQA